MTNYLKSQNFTLPPGVTIRHAKFSDAADICRLYREAYTPNSDCDPRLFYPFPQFMDVDWVVNSLSCDSFIWIVAELNQKAIGSVGALINIGDGGDRIAESFGLVIKTEYRNQGIGTSLFNEISFQIQQKALFIIAETRTAHPGGYRIVKSCGFTPIGFEPFAHFTTDGHESMLLTAKVSNKAMAHRRLETELTPKALSLAKTVTQSIQINIKLALNDTCFQNTHSLTESDTLLNISHRKSYESKNNFADKIQIARNDLSGPNLLKNMGLKKRKHRSGIINLSRMEGIDKEGIRYDCQYFVAEVNRVPVACARFVLDKIDKRCRLLQYQSNIDQYQENIIRDLILKMENCAQQELLQVVVDVQADQYWLHQLLEGLWFIPTAFYPGFVSGENHRIDAIQYTHFLKKNQVTGYKNLPLLKWSTAQSVANKITSFLP